MIVTKSRIIGPYFLFASLNICNYSYKYLMDGSFQIENESLDRNLSVCTHLLPFMAR